MTTPWVVVIEATAPQSKASVPITTVRELMERMATMHPTTLYSPERYALQVVVSAATPSDALLNALTAWRTAELDVGLAGQQLARAEVISSREYERERDVLERSTGAGGSASASPTDEAADDLLRRAFHDPLTGLANLDLFLSHLDHVLRRSARTGARHVLLLCDLDDFELVDPGGIEGDGDRVLTAVAERISSTVRPGDTVARLGRDEFAVLLDEATAPDSLAVARRLMAAISAPIDTSGRHVSVTTSVGIAAAEPGDDARHVLREARGALAAAKALGKNRCEAFDGAVCRGPQAERRRSVGGGGTLNGQIAVREGGG